jgi:hypothetical protein
MDSVARLLLPTQRRELFSETAAQMNMTPAIAEKDFWVCWTLSKLFAQPDLSRLLMFKGGTSLSKVFQLIERFSEDIDLVLDWNVVVGADDPLAGRSANKQDAVNKTIETKAAAYIGGKLLTMIQQAVAPICQCAIADGDDHTINVTYPAAFSDDYLRPEVRLEIGPLASWTPHDCYQIKPYAAAVFPQVFSKPDCTLRAIRAERTFWEKATILHHEAHRPEGNVQPARYSRHYYDLAMMAASPTRAAALADLALLDNVVAFKQRFYRRGWARYDLAKPGTFLLIPPEHVRKGVEQDYKQMRTMIFGRYPDFNEMLATLRALEKEINGLQRR